MSEIEINSAPITKEKRKYSPRKPKPQAIPEHLMAPPAPLPPNPNVLAAESRINELIEQRLQAQTATSRAHQQLQMAQSAFQYAKDDVSRLEQEINFRQSAINQMRGGGTPSFVPTPHPGSQIDYQSAENFYTNTPSLPISPPYAPAQGYPTYPPAFDPRQVPAQGVGSAPGFPVDPVTGRFNPYPDVTGGPNDARSSSAEELRSNEMRLRGH